MEVGLGPGDFVLDRDPAPLHKMGAEPSPQFSAHVYCRQTINMELGMKVGLGPDHTVLHGVSQSPEPIGYCGITFE